jgi:hypothetical protein
MQTVGDPKRWIALLVPLFLALVAACSSSHVRSHVRMVNPDTTGSSLYICDKTSCRPSDVDDPALFNQTGTQFIRLPRECKGRLNEVFVKNANSDAPQVFVRCAPPEPPLATMDEPKTPAPAPSVIDVPGATLPEMGDEQ